MLNVSVGTVDPCHTPSELSPTSSGTSSRQTGPDLHISGAAEPSDEGMDTYLSDQRSHTTQSTCLTHSARLRAPRSEKEALSWISLRHLGNITSVSPG